MVLGDYYFSSDFFSQFNIIDYIDPSYVGSSLGFSANTFSLLFNSLANLILFVLLTFYFSINTNGVNSIISVFTPKKYREYTLNLWGRAKKKIGLWAKGQVIVSLALSTFIFLGLLLIGIPNPFLFSLIFFIFSFIPIIGFVISIIPPILFALTIPDPLTSIILIIVLYVVLQQIEGALLTPLIINKFTDVSSILIISAVFIGGSVLGIVGIILALPIVMILKEIYLDKEKGNLGKVQKIEHSP